MGKEMQAKDVVLEEKVSAEETAVPKQNTAQEEGLTLEKFEEASEIVKKVISETKLVFSEYLSLQTGNKVYLKPENMQLTGAYKLRGAYYKIGRAHV